ncbi:MAG: acyltransferase family protein, partial [Selenomonadaceae bacterium]|nr:acyltransferase family protein [Selenomonadaceae bacterium]
MTMKNDSQRIYALDNLKWFIIWLMVVFHAAMCYMAFAPEWWYVVDAADPQLSATIFVCWADIFIMPAMFFVSGYFGLMSLSKHGVKKFWRGKFVRIILPWLVGAIFVAPLVTYIILASRHAPITFWKFYTELFWGVFYQQAQYWYLGALTALYLLLVWFCDLFPKFLTRAKGLPTLKFFATIFFISAVTIALISQKMPPDTWKFFGYILVLQPVRIPTYIAIFFAGAQAWRQNWFTNGGYVPKLWSWGIFFVLSGAIYISQRFGFVFAEFDDLEKIWLNAICQAAFTIAAVFFLTGFFVRKFNFTSRILENLSATSYAVYWLHMPILFFVAWIFVAVPLGVYLKYFSVCALTLGLCFILSRAVFIQLPGFSSKK